MSQLKLILHSLLFYWRAHLAAGLGAGVSTAVLVGALLVGDSIRHSLETMALERLGRTQFALNAGDRFFRDDLGTRMQSVARASLPAKEQPKSQAGTPVPPEPENEVLLAAQGV